jgi:CubicO group peptidase (beta-lactamase class C family)
VIFEALGGELTRLVTARQREWRAPGVVAAIYRHGGRVWECAVGIGDVAGGARVKASHQFQIGSVTKTHTAVAVMQLVAAGQLDLEAPVHEVLRAQPPRPALTLRRLLSHASGLQREPVGTRWDAPRFADSAAMLAGLPDAEEVMPPGERWHYSNLAFAVLGAVIAEATGEPFDVALQERVLTPAGLTRTTFTPQAPHARGYNVMPFSDAAYEEPVIDLGGWEAAGELWSTADDLGRWSDVLAGAVPDVLDPVSAERMHLPQVMFDPERFTLAYGLGLMLGRRGDRVYAGHGGSMPGYRAALFLHRGERIAAVALANSGVAATEGLAADLLDRVIDHVAEVAEWRPGSEPPADVAELLGVWWSEGSPFTVSWRGDAIEITGDFSAPPARLQPVATDRYRVVEGRERGELLEVVRNTRGDAVELRWASYPMLREPPKRTVGPDPY